MVKICEKHAIDNDLKFSSDPNPEKSKTLCVAFNCLNRESLPSIYLDGNPLPWKKQAKHIGNILHENGTMEKDVEVKRARFIEACHELNNQFEHLPSECQLKLMNIYNSHFTGSCLWNFDTTAAKKIFNSWNVNIKVIFDLPFNTHNYIIDQLSFGKNAKKMIFSRYIKFMDSIAKNRRHSLVS